MGRDNHSFTYGVERERDEKSPFLSDNRRGYARVTPVAPSRNCIPGLAMHTLDQYPVDGLGIYDDLESCSHFSGYVWSDWTTKTVQPMHIDDALKAMIDQPVKSGASTTMASSQLTAQSDSSANEKNKGSSVSAFLGVPPSPEPSKDVSMAASADKRSRESPDTTTKPDGKSWKTSEAASPSPARDDISESCVAGTHMSDVSTGQDANPRLPTNLRLANDASEARLLTRQMHKRVPAWKLQLCIEALNARPIDLARITEVTEIQFANDELVTVAAQCLADLAREFESTSLSTDHVGATSAASSQAEKESVNAGQENEPEGDTESTQKDNFRHC